MNVVDQGLQADPRLREAARRLAALPEVETIILFGSRARGDHTPDSDFDLCVLVADTVAAGVFTPVTLWREVSDLGIPIQIVPLRRSAFEAAKRDPNSISHEIEQYGRVLRLDRRQ
uniref:DNA polymerase, beta domain protein region n=1 Tax=Rhodopseudomonas palustris (strain BisA53) TaxID=316055 RepID=Q07GZ0_RHOP5